MNYLIDIITMVLAIVLFGFTHIYQNKVNGQIMSHYNDEVPGGIFDISMGLITLELLLGLRRVEDHSFRKAINAFRFSFLSFLLFLVYNLKMNGMLEKFLS